jgi:hypothetical protein
LQRSAWKRFPAARRHRRPGLPESIRSLRPAAVDRCPRRATTPEGADAQVKAAAQNLFAAKQPEKQESRKGFAIAIGLLTVLSVAGIGGYFWWQLQPKGSNDRQTSPAATARRRHRPRTNHGRRIASADSCGCVGRSQPPTAGQSGAGRHNQAAHRPPGRGCDDLDDGIDAGRLASVGSRLVRVDRWSPKMTARFASRASHCGSTPPSVAASRPSTAASLTMAQLEYERARKTTRAIRTRCMAWLRSPCVRDAHDQAEAYLSPYLESDPQDTVAQAALLNQRGQVDPNATESRLKSLAAASQPELAAPHFSLGNLYARHGALE